MSEGMMRDRRAITKCLYTDVCYLSESLRCYGYQTECVLYKPDDGRVATAEDFHKAMNSLIEIAKHHSGSK